MQKLVFLSLFAATFTVVLPAAHAQQNASRQGNRPQVRVEWPRTFGGQPDFEFERGEAFEQVQQEKSRAGLPSPVLPKLTDLLSDDRVEPLKIQGTATVSGSAPAQVDQEDGVAVLDDLNSYALGLGELPSLTQVSDIDLTQFEDSLVQMAQERVAAYNPDLASFSFEYIVKELKIDSIMVSPVQSTTINGVRYAVGDKMTLHVPVSLPDSDMLQAMQQGMPTGPMPEELKTRYEKAYENAVAKLAALRTASPEAFSKTLSVPVIIQAIHPRKVVVSIAGTEHEVAIKTR